MFALLVSARRTLDEIALAFDASSLSAAEALRVVDELGAVRRVTDGMLGRAARHAADTAAETANAVGSMARTLGVGKGEVHDAIETAKKLERLPATERAVRGGRLSSREAQLIAGAATKNPAAEQALLATADQGLVRLKDACVAARAAVEDPAERARRHHRQREWRHWTDADGMWSGRFRYAPEVGGRMKAAIEKEEQRIFRAHKAGLEHEPQAAYAADAVAGFVLGDASDDIDADADAPPDRKRATGVNATMHIVIDHGALVCGGTAGGDVCEIPGVGPVDVAWATELLGSAFLTLVIKKGKDITTVAHFGRHVPAEVLTALIVSGRECDIDECNHRGYLERDHVHDHARGGPTSFANLGWLCYRHHRLKSSGWQLGDREPGTGKRKLRPPPARAA